MSATSINVDDIAPVTPGLARVANNRCHPILVEWARLLSVWGTHGLYDFEGGRMDQSYTMRDLAVACYVQGARDAIAVAVSEPKLMEEANP